MTEVFFGDLKTLYTYLKTAEDKWTQASLTNMDNKIMVTVSQIFITYASHSEFVLNVF